MITRTDRPSYVDEAEGRAAAIRAQLGIGSDAIADVFELLEHLGLKVVRWPMGENGPDGFYLRKGDLALVAVNTAKRYGRQRFTACHELGHHLFDAHSRVDTDILADGTVPERRANAFAAYLLMPREGVERWLNRNADGKRKGFDLDAELVVHLARHFGMSYEATLYQLGDLHRLGPQHLERLKREQPERIARRLGYSLHDEEGERGRRVLPPDYVRRALQAYAAGYVSLARLAELLRIDEPSARSLAVEAGVETPEPSLDELVDETLRA